MPDSIKFLDDFKKIHDSRNAFCRLFSRGNEQRIETAEKFLKQVVDTCEFCLCMPFDGLEKALADDEIKEMSETGTGATNGGIEVRREAMQNLYGLDSTKYTSKEMPKYGLLVGPEQDKDLIKDPDVFYHYGQVMITFRKENIIDRTTLTVGSSLNFTESLLKTPTFVSDPKFICIKGMPKRPELGRKGFFMGLNFMVDFLIGEKKLDPNYPNSMAILADDMLGFEDFEIQIFGKLTFSEDVKSIKYFVATGNEEEDVKRITPLLNKYNLTCEELF